VNQQEHEKIIENIVRISKSFFKSDDESDEDFKQRIKQRIMEVANDKAKETSH